MTRGRLRIQMPIVRMQLLQCKSLLWTEWLKCSHSTNQIGLKTAHSWLKTSAIASSRSTVEVMKFAWFLKDTICRCLWNRLQGLDDKEAKTLHVLAIRLTSPKFHWRGYSRTQRPRLSLPPILHRRLKCMLDRVASNLWWHEEASVKQRTKTWGISKVTRKKRIRILSCMPSTLLLTVLLNCAFTHQTQMS